MRHIAIGIIALLWGCNAPQVQTPQDTAKQEYSAPCRDSLNNELQAFETGGGIVENNYTLIEEAAPDSLNCQKGDETGRLIGKRFGRRFQQYANKKGLVLFVGIIGIGALMLAFVGFVMYKVRKKNKIMPSPAVEFVNSQPRNVPENIPPVKLPMPKPEPKPTETKDANGQKNSITAGDVNAFAVRNDNCIVVGASVIGNSHISLDLPCQDNCGYAYIKSGWGIAIISDGAGSAKHSDVGSRIVVNRGIHYFQSVIEQKKWIEKELLPTEAEWTNIAYTTLKAIRDDMKGLSNTKKVEFGSLSATIIVVIHTPFGFLTTHVGDGRAGYLDDTNEWKAFITPHKGEEANQTIFLTSDFWELPYYVMSGVLVPESHVVCCRPTAFTLMSDGCEHTAWQCNMRNESTGVYYDPNKPFDRFFNPLVLDLSSDNDMEIELKTRWAKFITSGNNSFENEPDDKTMILGVIK